MKKEAKEQVERLITTILSRSKPRRERKNLEHFLKNVLMFIKRARGIELSDEERKYPTAPYFAHYLMGRGSEAADALERRLNIIEYYNITDAHRITYIITSTTLDPYRPALTERKMRLLGELYDNPILTQDQLAQRLSVSPRIIRREVQELRRDFAFRILTFTDSHKFKLTQQMVYFRTKSLDTSEKLERYYREAKPLFLRRIAFDHDYRQGYMVYQVPNQPRGQQLFDRRLRALNDDYFEECYNIRLLGQGVIASLKNYDYVADSWLLEADVISEAMLQLARSSVRIHPNIREMIFSESMRFDKVDFLLAQMSFIDSGSSRIDFRQDVLKRFGFELANKTIWAREQKLRKAGIFFPIVYYSIPKFEENVVLIIHCSERAREQIHSLLTLLPYAFYNQTDTGVSILFQRPTGCPFLTCQLVRAISYIPEVENIHLLRLPLTIGASINLKSVERWDSSRQRWLLQETDF